jgi:hypothetical protein
MFVFHMFVILLPLSSPTPMQEDAYIQHVRQGIPGKIVLGGMISVATAIAAAQVPDDYLRTSCTRFCQTISHMRQGINGKYKDIAIAAYQWPQFDRDLVCSTLSPCFLCQPPHPHPPHTLTLRDSCSSAPSPGIQ